MRGLRGFVMAAVGAMIVATSLSGCAALLLIPAAAGAPAPLPSIVGEPRPLQAPQASQAPPVQHYSDGSTSERGNIPKVVGEKAGILTPDGQTRLVTFIVTRLLADPLCLNAEPPAPTNGHYLEVDLQVITTADLADEGDASTVTFSPDNWFFYPPDSPGLVAGGIGATGDNDDCELSVPPLPDSIGPSQNVTGSVLLDVSDDSHYVAYAPDNGCGCGSAWEWPYPAAG